MTPAIWTDVQDDLDAASLAIAQAVAKEGTLGGLAPDLRADREIAIGKHLHDAFSAAEKALQRLVMAADGSLPLGQTFHRDLIARAARAEAGRPALLDARTADDLIALMRFRHAFRHVYGGFDYARAAPNIALAARAIPRLRDEITAFAASLGLAPRA